MNVRSFIFFCFCCICFNSSIAQEDDAIENLIKVDTSIVNINDSLMLEVEDTTSNKRPAVDKKKIKRTALASIILPGLGQAFNKQIYKTPIYPGAIVFSISTGLAYRSTFNKYSDSLALASNIIIGGDSIRNKLRIKQNNARRINNAAFGAAGFMYAANIIDAYVSAQIKERSKNMSYSPMLSAYRSAALPGLGQVTNKQYWKVPVFWLLLSGAGLAAVYTNNQKQCYTNLYLNRVRYNYEDAELIDRCFSNPNLNNIYTDNNLLIQRAFYKRYFEISLIAMGAIYVLNIADALVYSHLNNFDIDDSLDLSVQPVFMPAIGGNNYFGINLKLSL